MEFWKQFCTFLRSRNSPQPSLILQPEADPPGAEREGVINPPLKVRGGEEELWFSKVTLCIK